jgi:predicted porin
VPLGEAPAAGPVGPFRFAPLLEAVGPLRVQVFGTVETEFTDNIDQTKDNKESAFLFRLAPGIAARIDREATSGLLLYAPQAVIEDTGDSTLNHALTARGRWRPTPFIELSGGDDFVRSDDFRDQNDAGTRRTGRDAFIENQAAFEAAYLPPNWRAALGYTHRLVENDNDEDEDSQTHIVRPSLRYQAPRWSAEGGYALTRGELSLSPSYWEHTVDGRFTRLLTPTLTGILTGLYTTHEEDTETGTDFVIGRARVGAAWAGAERRLELQAGADVFSPDPGDDEVRPSGLVSYTERFAWFALTADYQAGFQERFQEVDNAGVSFTQQAGVVLTTTAFRALTGTLALRWSYNDFQTTTSTVAADTSEHTYDLELGVRYQLLRPLFISAGYVLTIRDSDDPEDEFTENRIRLGLTYTFDLI